MTHLGAGTFGSDIVCNCPQLGSIASLFEANSPVWEISLLTCSSVKPSSPADEGEGERTPNATGILTHPGLILIPQSARRQKHNASISGTKEFCNQCC